MMNDNEMTIRCRTVAMSIPEITVQVLHWSFPCPRRAAFTMDEKPHRPHDKIFIKYISYPHTYNTSFTNYYLLLIKPNLTINIHTINKS